MGPHCATLCVARPEWMPIARRGGAQRLAEFNHRCSGTICKRAEISGQTACVTRTPTGCKLWTRLDTAGTVTNDGPSTLAPIRLSLALTRRDRNRYAQMFRCDAGANQGAGLACSRTQDLPSMHCPTSLWPGRQGRCPRVFADCPRPQSHCCPRAT